MTTITTTQIGSKYRAHNGIWIPRNGTTVTSVPARSMGTNSSTLAFTPLADDQPLYGAGSYESALAATFNLRRSSTPVAGYYDPPYNTQTTTVNYGFPIYTMSADHPRTGVYVVNDALGHTGLQEHCNNIPVPLLENIPGGRIQAGGNDSSVIFLCENEIWEFWKFQPAAAGSAAANAGYSWQATWGGYHDDITTWNGYATAPNYWCVHADGSTLINGLLRPEDYYSGEINHAIGMAWPCTSPSFIAPATRYDSYDMLNSGGNSVVAYQIPEGAWFRLPASFDTAAWAAANHGQYATQEVVEMIVKAIQKYGFYLNDTAGVIAICAEGSQSYGTPYSPYTEDQIPQWGNPLQYMPWDQMVQIAPRSA